MSRVSQSKHKKQEINTQSKTKLQKVELDNVSAALNSIAQLIEGVIPMKKQNKLQVQQSKTKPQSPVKNLTEVDLDAISGGLQEEFQAELATLEPRPQPPELGFRFPCDGPGRGGTC